MPFERQILCCQYIKEIGADPKQNPEAHHKHLHADLTLYCLKLHWHPIWPKK